MVTQLELSGNRWKGTGAEEEQATSNFEEPNRTTIAAKSRRYIAGLFRRVKVVELIRQRWSATL